VKFRNVSDDARDIPSLDLRVEPGETTPDFDKKTAAGFLGQTETWVAVGSEAKTAQKKEADKQSAPVEVKE